MSEHVHHTVSSPEITFPPEPSKSTSRIWKIFWLLSAVTIVELVLGFGIARNWYSSDSMVLFVKGAVCILSFAKAYYIVSVFMHLGDEIRNFIMTIVVPLLLFVWFIIAFLADGDSWKNLRNTNAGSRTATEQTQPKK
ncbi:MAG: cytochrome C oxidase subunit IV family protein [Ferruginibacter sp.]